MRDRLGEHLWSKQREIAESVRDNRYTAVQSCHDAGKCVYYLSVIPLADGRLVPARELIGRYFAVQTFLEEGTQRPALAWATDNGVKPVWRVTTSSGRSVERTGNHPLYVAKKLGGGTGRRLTVDPIGWSAVEKLEVGDLVLIPEQLTIEGQRRRGDDEVGFLGYMLGDGGTTKYVGFTQKNGAAKDDYTRIVRSWGCDVREAGKYGLVVVGPDGDRFGRKGSNPVLNRIRDWGLLGTKAKEKKFPDWAWELPNDQLALLLNRLFACDGWANTRSGARGGIDSVIAIALASERMIRDVEMAMLRLGIVGAVRARTTKLDGREFQSWEWSARRLADLRRFRAMVGIIGKEAAVDQAVSAKETTNGRIAHWMNQKAPAGYRWDTVTSIESLGDQPTVTISVPETHTYLTTFVEHNSFLASRLVAWWLDVHPRGEAFAVTTAPTAAQVSAILWREIRRAHRKGGLFGYITQGAVPEWKLPDGEQVGYGRKPADEDQAAFQGIHALYPLIVVDEGGGVPKTLFDAVDALATNINARVLAIGNPDDPSSHFAKVCKPGSGWNVIRIDGLQTPNMTAEAVAEHPELADLMADLAIEPSVEEVPDGLRPLLLSPMWVAERIFRWGIASPIFTAKVRGDFPDIGEDVLITPSMIRAAQERHLDPGPRSILGVDVARFGSDRTIIALTRWPQTRVVGDYSKLATTQTTGHVVAAKREHMAHEIRVDGVGVGGGVVDQLVELGHDVMDMQAGAAARDSEHYLNARAEWYWALRQRFEAGGVDLDPDDDETAAQLGAIKYKYTARGQIQIESKDDMRKRKLPSPDRADAVMLTAGAVPPPEQVVEDEEADDYAISPY